MMTPKTEDELAAYVASADAPIWVQGGGTRGLEGEGAVLSTASMSGIELYEPGALTIVVKAGTPVADVETALAAENQRLPFEPIDYRGLTNVMGTPTIGSVIATNNSGSRRIQVGAARDFALGVRYVDGMGQIVKNGGRVMKNVTGYDLVKLMSGSWGTLGVLTEVALKVLPAPETEATVMIHGLSNAMAVEAMASALGSPYDVSGAAHSEESAASVTLIRIEGFEASVTYRVAQLTKQLAQFGADITCATADSSAIWQDVNAQVCFQQKDGDIWRVSVAPSDGAQVIAAAGAEQATMDWAGGLVWLRMAPGTDLRTRLRGFKGHATLVRGSGFSRFHPEEAGVAMLTKGLRQRFDPKGILNPGLMAA